MRYLLAIFAATIIAAAMDACEADKPKGKIDTSKVYSDEQEQREMYGHTGADAYEIMMTKKSKSDTVAHDSRAAYDDPRNLKIKLVAGRWEVESALPVRIWLQDGFIENNGDSVAMGFEYNFEKAKP